MVAEPLATSAAGRAGLRPELDHRGLDESVARQVALPRSRLEAAAVAHRAERCANPVVNRRIFRRLQIAQRVVIRAGAGIVRHRYAALVLLVEHEQLRWQLNVDENILHTPHAAVAENDADIAFTPFPD